MRTLFQTIKQQFLEENDLVLVSVTACSGSTPRGAGSRMLVGKSGRISGTIGGGAVEYRAECMALDILEKKESCQHEFRLNHKDVENIGMICGGDVTAFFQYLDHNDPIIMEITETAEKFYEAGMNVMAVAYRDVDGAPSTLSGIPVELIANAVYWCKENVAEKIGIWGISLGGQLALFLGSLYNDLISCVVAINPMHFLQQGMSSFKKMEFEDCSCFTFEGKDLFYCSVQEWTVCFLLN